MRTFWIAQISVLWLSGLVAKYVLAETSCRVSGAPDAGLCCSYVYIPVLPSSLLEVVTTPTPFIMGAHSSVLRGMPDLVSGGERRGRAGERSSGEWRRRGVGTVETVGMKGE